MTYNVNEKFAAKGVIYIIYIYCLMHPFHLKKREGPDENGHHSHKHMLHMHVT